MIVAAGLMVAGAVSVTILYGLGAALMVMGLKLKC